MMQQGNMDRSRAEQAANKAEELTSLVLQSIMGIISEENRRRLRELENDPDTRRYMHTSIVVRSSADLTLYVGDQENTVTKALKEEERLNLHNEETRTHRDDYFGGLVRSAGITGRFNQRASPNTHEESGTPKSAPSPAREYVFANNCSF
jgi:hypothetical protein